MLEGWRVFFFVAKIVTASHGKAKIKADALAMWDEEDFFDDEEWRKAPAWLAARVWIVKLKVKCSLLYTS